MFVIDARLLIFIARDPLELRSQSSALDRILPRLCMHIERPSLGTHRREHLTFEDGSLDTMEMQNTSKREPSGAASNDGNTWFFHKSPSAIYINRMLCNKYRLLSTWRSTWNQRYFEDPVTSSTGHPACCFAL